MPIYQRNDCWYVDIAAPDGKRIRRSAGTVNRKEAQEYHDRLKADLWRVHRLGDRQRRTWDEAALRWLKESQHKRSLKKDKIQIRKLTPFWRGVMIDELTRDEIARVIGTFDITPSTKNRYSAMVRAILRKCEREWNWLEKAPAVAMFKEPKRRVRWLTSEQAARLLAELPEHQRAVVTFALATGLRQQNALTIEWSQIDMQRRAAWIHGDQAKTGEAIGIALNDTAIAILRQQIGKHLTRVFTYRGRPFSCANTKAWRNALTRAGIENFRWHDLRHCWASWLVQAGTPLAALQEMGKWQSAEMVRRYAHLSPEHLAVHAQAIDVQLGTNPAHKERRSDVAASDLR